MSIPALCDAIAALGNQVALHVTDAGEPVRPEMGRCVLTVHRCLPGTGRGAGQLGLAPTLHHALVNAARDGDVVHSHGLWLWTNLDAYWATRKRRARVVLSPHGMLEPYGLARNRRFKDVVWRLGQGPAARAAHCIHATAVSEYESVRALGLRNPIAIVSNGVAVPELRAKRVNQRKRVLFLGRIDHKKGIDFLLYAWKQVAHDFPDWEVAIVGAPTRHYEEEIRRLAADVAAPRVLFLPPAYGPDRDEMMSSADLFVLPTRSENFAMTVAEALACRVPVICSKGAPWARLDEERCGYWVDLGVEPLAAGLRKALTLPEEERQAMGDRGREWMIREFGWDAQATRMADVYRWLASGGDRPSCVKLD